MILSGKEIVRRLGKGIVIDPFRPENVNPNSYNLRLHNELYVYRGGRLDMKAEGELKKVTIPESGLVLKPGRLYLGRTLEYTKTEDYVPMLEGRSSIGRLGMFVHVSAGFGDIGFAGYWTLEIFCVHPLKIYPNVAVCQIYYHTIEGGHDSYARGKYQNNDGVQASLLYKEFRSDGG